MSHPSVPRLFPASWMMTGLSWLVGIQIQLWCDWLEGSWNTPLMTQASKASNGISEWVVWFSVTHGNCQFWTINPASIQPTPHISLLALQAFRSSSLSLLAPTTNYKNPLQIMGSVSRSAVFSLYSDSVRLGLRKQLQRIEIKELRSDQGHGHTSRDAKFILNEHEIIIV